LPKDEKQPQRELKVTDKRIFTADGQIREEFRGEIQPAEPVTTAEASPAPPADAQAKPQPNPQPEPPPQQQKAEPPQPSREERRRKMTDRAENPGTQFTNFIEPLIAQGYMALGLLRNPYEPQSKIDPRAARQMIDILQLLQEKTKNNLTPDEEDFLETHLGELKLAYVQRTKSI
jgi:outer membrane biosynthesis protein TonB